MHCELVDKESRYRESISSEALHILVDLFIAVKRLARAAHSRCFLPFDALLIQQVGSKNSSNAV